MNDRSHLGLTIWASMHVTIAASIIVLFWYGASAMATLLLAVVLANIFSSLYAAMKTKR